MSDCALDIASSAGIRLIREILPDAVLIKVKRGEKRPLDSGWQKLTQVDMTDGYLGSFGDCNIGVLLGRASGDLNTIDIDVDEYVDAFLELNPRLRGTLRTTRIRGQNLWLQTPGDYPKLGAIKTAAGKNWGEWRSAGGQTIISGEAVDRSRGETQSTKYRIVNHAPPIQIPFGEIVWPPGLRLPWQNQLVALSNLNQAEALSEDDDADEHFIILPSGPVSISECARRLFRKIAPTETLFFRGGAIVELEIDQISGRSRLSIVRPSGFRSRIERYGTVFAWRSGANGKPALQETRCPEETAKALLNTIEARELLPPISTIVNCPVAVETAAGLALLGAGYHDVNGGMLITGGDMPPQVELQPAVARLKALLNEFDFQTQADRSRAQASLLTPALKMGGFIAGHVPADIAEADQSQAGKTYRQRVGAAIYGEIPSLIAPRSGGVGSVDESFAQALVAGRPFIQLDNFRGKLDSSYIESFLTAIDIFSARVPHCAEVTIDPRRFFLLMSSNGVETTRDMANRSSIIRIRKRQRHEFRRYPEGDLLDHVQAQQPFYLGCVFSVIKAWLEAGKSLSTVADHDFREWAQILDWIIVNIFHMPPLLDGHRVAQERVADLGLTFLRNIALVLLRDGRMGEQLSASALSVVCEESGIEIPGLRSNSLDHAKRQVGIIMGRIFRITNQVVLDDFTVERQERLEPRAEGGAFNQKLYVFKLAVPLPAPVAQATQEVQGPRKLQYFPEGTGSFAASAERADTADVVATP